MTNKDYQPPPRKEPGFIGRLISAIVKCLSWLVLSIVLSIVIEWIGMVTIWKEEGANHSQRVLIEDQRYLNEHLQIRSGSIKIYIAEKSKSIVDHINKTKWITSFKYWVAHNSEDSSSRWRTWIADFQKHYEPYLQSANTITQISIVRIAIITFSLPVFGLLVLVGAVDGLVERDLRRWGGGRESSNIYNLARKSVFPSFIAACVIYISLPFSLSPTFVVLPFATIMALSTRIMFERLKKYF